MPAFLPQTLEDWLHWQQQRHHTQIDLGLGRIGEVANRLSLRRPAPRVLTIGGTNGKGSTAAFAAAMAAAGGLRVGLYSSPHLFDYTERIRIDGAPVAQGPLLAAFERIEHARGEISLTYFEYGTLAALLLFADAGLDLAVLEVGLGGRLDAVNLIDADVAVVTRVALDHMAYLGADRDAIGREKAGIARPGRPLVIGEPNPPAGLLQAAGQARLVRAGQDFRVADAPTGWCWQGAGHRLELPAPALAGRHQQDNAATAIAALDALELGLTAQAFRAGVRAARLPGRCESCRVAGVPALLDVAHNADAAAVLAAHVRSHWGRAPVVLAMREDKDATAFVAALAPATLAWHLAPLPEGPPTEVRRLAAAVAAAGGRIAGEYADVPAAVAAAAEQASPPMPVVVTGSFLTVAAVRAAGL